MCGIAAFVGKPGREELDLGWVEAAAARLGDAADAPLPAAAEAALDTLDERFDELMSFALHHALMRQATLRARLEQMAERLQRLVAEAETRPSEGPAAERLVERARDYAWQLRWEVLDNQDRTLRLLGSVGSAETCSEGQHYGAWAIEQVLENLERLEVRGRDSAGLRIVCVVPAELARELEARDARATPAASCVWHDGPGGAEATFIFTFKVANPIGRLGDNTARLRELIQTDRLLWRVVGDTRQLNIVAHTRWASNGIISIPNCHPVDAQLLEERIALRDDVAAVLNGDVDNYDELRAGLEREGHQLDPHVTTDAKMPPLLFRLRTSPEQPLPERFAHSMNQCQGSLALVMQSAAAPHRLLLGLKGSGQALYFSEARDAWLVASEIYGLAARARQCFSLSGLERGGMQATLDTAAGRAMPCQARFLDGTEVDALAPTPIEIFSRDIYRGTYRYYLEKELHEAPRSIRKTLEGKYTRDGAPRFADQGPDSFATLIARLRDPAKPAIDSVLVIGQGTAAVAAMGVAHLVEQAAGRALKHVRAAKASELSAFFPDMRLDSTLLVAISQSGTTTDTNRTVDLAMSRGAWAHAIVNRRGSSLAMRSDSHTYTSDGRDVEMSVASTKAFYSQIAAGKLLALVLAQQLQTMHDESIRRQLAELETLADKVEAVLAQRDELARSAREAAAQSPNWAVVGNGPNLIAAHEIRIKLSELCYKSIPCDFTEDKKHIDLSTEPLTIIVANDLPEDIVQDTVKEVAIFKAHGGRPIVLCSQGESRFDDYAEHVIRLPATHSDLGFVLATVAGHLWGFYAATSIDDATRDLRELRVELTEQLEQAAPWYPGKVQDRFDDILEDLSRGRGDAAVPARYVAELARYRLHLGDAARTRDASGELLHRGIAVLSTLIEAMTRPVDSIRHQAKTVTVGISRPQAELAPAILDALTELGISTDDIKPRDADDLRVITPLLHRVPGALVYELMQGPETAPVLLKSTARFGICRGQDSRYDAPKPPAGTKRTVLRLQHMVWSTGAGRETLALLPVFAEQSRDCTKLLLLHLDFAPRAPLPTKLHVLRNLGNRYDELIERAEEVLRDTPIEDFIERTAPRDLVIEPLARLLPA